MTTTPRDTIAETKIGPGFLRIGGKDADRILAALDHAGYTIIRTPPDPESMPGWDNAVYDAPAEAAE